MPGRSKTRTRTRKWDAIDLISRPSDNGYDVEDVEEEEPGSWRHLFYLALAVAAVVLAGFLILGGAQFYSDLMQAHLTLGPAITVCPVPTGKP
jgi:hypothetical protein